MSNFAYIPFTSIDYKGQPSLSSFALKETPLTFIPDLTNFNPNNRVLWIFGDGTTSTAISAVKSYENAGTYTVNFVVYDCFSKSQISTSSQKYHIKNYIDETFTLHLDDNVWKNGQINGPIEIKSYAPINTKISDVYYTVTGSNSMNYELINHDKFAHLKPTYQFYTKIYNYFLQSDQFRTIDKIKFENQHTIYAKISGNSIIQCDETCPGSFAVGLSSENFIYFKDDSISDKITIDFFLDRSNLDVNNLTITLSASIIENDEVERLSITSNGVDGEFYTISSFNIDPIKFYNAWIPFVIKIKDATNHSVKNFEISGFNIEVLSSNTPINSQLYELSTFDMGYGYMYGGVKFPNLENPIEDIQLYANQTLINDQGSEFNLNGTSSFFSVYPSNFITFQKKNEDFDMTETLKSLRFQEILLDNNVLFDEYIRSIFGDITSSPDSLGKKIHEKIANFFQNHYDIDRCEVTALISLMDMVGLDSNTYESSQLKYPEKIKRLINLLSIKPSKLFGFENLFSENFNPRGGIPNDTFGKNLGNKIDTNTYTITAGTPIVSHEKFSKDYSILNTYQPISSTGSNYYKLSGYTDDWGWGLVLPDNFTYTEIEKFYDFYEYIPGFSAEIVENTIIPMEDPDFDNRIRDILYQTLELNTL